MSEVIEHVLSPDKRRRITIYRRSDGCFEYSLDELDVFDVTEIDVYEECWRTERVWGIYDTALTALREASVEFCWVTKGVKMDSGLPSASRTTVSD